MTRERAKRLAAEWSFGGVCTLRGGEDAEYHKLFYELLCQQEHFREDTKKVEPLTMDELRKMDGEPVWVQFLHNKIGYWDLIRWHNSEFIRSYRSVFLLIDEYGKTWLAYRHKPEEYDHDERKENENA